MLPIALLPVAGLLLGIGGSFSNTTMLETYGLTRIMGPGTFWNALFTVMSQAGDIVFANLPILFAMGIAIGMAKKEKEVAALGVDLGTSVQVNYAVGDTVTISGTAMDGFSGIVQNINLEDGTVDVMISMFGRETAATLQLNQVIRQDD